MNRGLEKDAKLNYMSPLTHCGPVTPFGSKLAQVMACCLRTPSQERALRFVLKDSNSDYETLSSKSDFDSFRISSVMAVEIYKILNGMGPEYLSTLFSKSNVPYQLRDGNKLP